MSLHSTWLARGTRACLLVAVVGGVSACRSRESEGVVVISEFLAANTHGLKDGDRETSDWIELHNPTNATVNLADWRLTDTPDDPDRWHFPAVSIPPNGYLVVFASGKLESSTPTELHTSFRLKASADYLALLYPNGRVASEFAPYPQQQEDVSFGLNEQGAPTFLSHPTPGAPNAPSATRQALVHDRAHAEQVD